MASITTILVDSTNVDKAALRSYFVDREAVCLPVSGNMEMQSGAKILIDPSVSEVGLGFRGDGTESGMNYIHASAYGFMVNGDQIMTFHDSGVFIADANGMRCIIGSADSYTDDNGQIFEVVNTGNAAGGATFTYFSAGDSNSALLIFQKSAGAAVGQMTATNVNGEVMGSIQARGTDGTDFLPGASIDFEVGSGVATGIVPGRMKFNVTNGSGALTEAGRIDQTQQWFFPAAGTTASAANAVLNNGSSPANQLLRSTSTRAFKTGFAVLSDVELDRFELLEPVAFRSQHWHDDPHQVFLGFTAENAYDVDPRLATLSADGEPESVDERAILMMTVAYVQRLGRELAALKP
jgi:hypothetical protein